MSTTKTLALHLHNGLLRAAFTCLGAVTLLTTSCNDGGGDTGSPGVGQSVAGKNWTGSLYATDGTNRRALKATITQTRDADGERAEHDRNRDEAERAEATKSGA